MNKRKVVVFENRFLEALTHVNPLTPLILWGPFAVFFAWRALAIAEMPLTSFFLTGMAALLSWTLVEYCLHRFAFHWSARTDWGKRFVYIAHGLHHDDAGDPTRLVMPPLPAALYMLIFYLLFYLIVGPQRIDAFFSFFIVGYLCYDYIHYSVHFLRPKSKIGQFLRRHHLQHHALYKAKFGVSSPLWDIVFRTMANPVKQQR